jgi:YVTN family beta-propeller protein
MKELFNSKKMVLLQVIAVLVVCVFLSSSAFVSMDQAKNNNITDKSAEIKTLVHAYHPESNTLSGESNFISVGSNPQGMILDSSNGLIYIANWGSHNITIVNSKTNTVVDTINNLPSNPREFAIDTLTNELLVTDVGIPAQGVDGCYVTVIDLSNNSIVQNINLGGAPWGIAFDPHNGLVYVSDVNEGLIVLESYYNSSSGEYNFINSQTLSVGFWPETVLYDPLSYNIYVAVTGPGPCPGSTNYIAVVDTTNESVIADVPVIGNPEALAFGSQNNYVYAGVFENQIFVINGINNTVIKTINVCTGDYLEYVPQGNFILTDNNSTVDVLGATNGQLIEEIPAISGAWGILYDQLNGYLYVANSNTNKISFKIFTNTSFKLFPVKFKESGLPSGTSWSVTLNGITESSTSSNITFTEPNGTYTYTVSNVSGYSISQSSGSIIVNGNNVSQEILFNPKVEINVLSEYSGLLYENVSLTDTIGVYSHWGSSFPVYVNGTMDGINISFSSPATQDAPWNYTFNVENLPKTNSVTAYAHYQNGSVLRFTYNFTAISIPGILANLLNYSNLLKVDTNSSIEWNSNYSISANVLLNLPTIANVNISKLPLIGGNYSILPEVSISFNLSSTGNLSLSAGLSAEFNRIDIGPVGIAAHFDISATGILQITNDSLIFKEAKLFIDVGGSFSVNVPTPFGFNVSGVGIGIFLTFTVSPNVAVNSIISVTNNTTDEFIKGLGLAIDNITSHISVPFTVEGTASAVIASVSLGGTVTVNFNLSSGSPLMRGGNLTGVIFVVLHALFWTDQIDVLGPGTLYSWNATDPVINYAHSSGSFVITGEYWNVSGYSTDVWENGSLSGTAIHDIYPQTSVYSTHYGSSNYFAFTYDNLSRNVTRAIEIRGFIIRNHRYYPWQIPLVNAANAFSPAMVSLPNGSLLLVWHSLPYNESSTNPLSWNYIPVQYAYFNPSTGTWSSVMNLTGSDVAQSVTLSIYSDKVMVSVDVSQSLFSNYSYLEIYSLGNKNINYESRLSGIASIAGYSAQSSIVVLKYLNGTYEVLNVSSDSEIALPSFGNYTVAQVGITGNTSSTLYILYRSNSSALAALYDPYNGILLREITLNSSVESVSFQKIDQSYVFVMSTVNRIYVYQSSLNGLNLSNQYVSANINEFGTLTYGNTMEIYWLNNYGNQSEPLLNLSLAYVTVAYNVTFTESNLPSGTSWYVNLSNGMDSDPITGTSYSLSLPNGTYTFTIATSDHEYAPVAYSGSVTVSGKSVSESITFSLVTYSVTFTETGIESGQSWNVDINDVTHTVTGSSFTLLGTNGTSFRYSIMNSSSYYTTGLTSGEVSINGKDITVTLSFEHYSYIVGSFNQTNVNVTVNGKNFTVTSGKFTYKTTAGTYSVEITEKGYVTVYKNFTLQAGQTVNISVNLKKEPVQNTDEIFYVLAGVIAVMVIASAVIVYLRKVK